MLTLDPMFHKVVASGSNIESSVDRIKKARAETSNGITEQMKGHGGKDAGQNWGYPSSSTGLQVSRVRKKRWCQLRRSMYWEANGHYSCRVTSRDQAQCHSALRNTQRVILHETMRSTVWLRHLTMVESATQNGNGLAPNPKSHTLGFFCKEFSHEDSTHIYAILRISSLGRDK